MIIIGYEKVYGLLTIFPTNINWLMSIYHDWGQYYIGWAYFESEPWNFPIGKIENFNYPAGTNIGYTDSIPLMAILCKSLSFLLPETFQYFGFWLFICHFLLGHYSWKLLRLFHVNKTIATIGAILIALNPLIIYVGMHPSTCMHWLILASMYYYFSDCNKITVKKLILKQLAWLVFAAWVNPYMFLFVLGFTIILLFKLWYYDKLISSIQTFLYLIIPNLIVLASWYVIGLVDFSGKVDMEVSGSYGLYGFNLNSFFNSRGYSMVLPQLEYYKPHQYEGYAYFGIGLMLLIVISSIYFFVKWCFSKSLFAFKKRWTPLLIITLLFSLFAITHNVTYNEHLLFEFPLPDLLIKFGNTFRASGRYIWVMYYLLIVFAIIVYNRIPINKFIKISILFLLFLMQYMEWPLPKNTDRSWGSYSPDKLTIENWQLLSSQFNTLITYPPHTISLQYHYDYQDICYAILPNKIPITNGYVARETSSTNKAYLDKLNKELLHHGISENQLIITTNDHIAEFSHLIASSQVMVGILDNYFFLYNKSKKVDYPEHYTLKEQQLIDSIHATALRANYIMKLDTTEYTSSSIASNLEVYDYVNGKLHVSGWAYLSDTENNSRDSIYIGLRQASHLYLIKANPIIRHDVTTYFKRENLDNSGFDKTVNITAIDEGKYEVLVVIKNKNGKFIIDSFNNINYLSK